MQRAFLIPVFNHGSSLSKVVSSLQKYDLPIIVVDDGNDSQNKNLINEVVARFPKITLVVNKRNRGKGFSVCRGIKEAYKLGITHLFQIDADGQHDAQTCDEFLHESQSNPEALICGFPEFDESIPKARLKAKEISNNYSRFVTLDKTGEMKDAMCGFRIYPVKPFYEICRRTWIDTHMGFDSEILVRMIWRGVPVIYKSVHVTYPIGNKSNFRVIRDNIHISLMFARLTVGMWIRYPILRGRKKREALQK